MCEALYLQALAGLSGFILLAEWKRAHSPFEIGVYGTKVTVPGCTDESRAEHPRDKWDEGVNLVIAGAQDNDRNAEPGFSRGGFRQEGASLFQTLNGLLARDRGEVVQEFFQ